MPWSICPWSICPWSICRGWSSLAEALVPNYAAASGALSLVLKGSCLPACLLGLFTAVGSAAVQPSFESNITTVDVLRQQQQQSSPLLQATTQDGREEMKLTFVFLQGFWSLRRNPSCSRCFRSELWRSLVMKRSLPHCVYMMGTRMSDARSLILVDVCCSGMSPPPLILTPRLLASSQLQTRLHRRFQKDFKGETTFRMTVTDSSCLITVMKTHTAAASSLNTTRQLYTD